MGSSHIRSCARGCASDLCCCSCDLCCSSHKQRGSYRASVRSCTHLCGSSYDLCGGTNGFGGLRGAANLCSSTYDIYCCANNISVPSSGVDVGYASSARASCC